MSNTMMRANTTKQNQSYTKQEELFDQTLNVMFLNVIFLNLLHETVL